MTLPVSPAWGPRYTVAAVARRFGVAPATLRTWDRRYRLGPSDHEAGTRRRYSPTDVARLELMRRLTLDGVAPAEAARLALKAAETPRPTVDPAEADGVGWTLGKAPPEGGRGGDAVGPLDADLPQRLDQAYLGPARSGGRVLALPGASATARGLARAAMALDAAGMSRIVRRSLDTEGVVATWDELLRPVLAAAGRRWALTGEGVDVEHLLSECVVGALRQVLQRVGELTGRRAALLACSAADQHSLPLHALAAALAGRELAPRVLGPALPAGALHNAVQRTGPAALFVWAQLASTADPGPLDALPTTRPPTQVVVGGPGWLGVRLPRRAVYAESLTQAVELVCGRLAA